MGEALRSLGEGRAIRKNKFLGGPMVHRVDIVNEGSVRTRERWPGQT